ncbi:MAG: hypothetical protein KatS3mg053_0801 [Candidatus Roseilinea sp.]|nr:MAG: hypothetical protein KatS3mg053_0801 [Candidatus Roseilinea sp.]
MNRTIETSGSPELVIECKGDLEVEGLRPGELGIEVESDDERANIATDGNRVVISVEDDTEVRAPRDAVVYIAAVSGDLEVKGFDRVVNIGHVGGDLEVEDVGGADIHSVGGDCELQDVVGAVAIRAIGGDLQAEGVALAGQSVNVGGDVALRLVSVDDAFTVNAGGDIALALPAGANVIVHVTDAQGMRRLTFGAGEAVIRANAGGEVSVSSDREASDEATGAPGWGDAVREIEREMSELQRHIEQMAREFGQRFASFGMPAWKVERAQQQAEAAIRKMEAKLQHRLRHIEARARKEAERASAKAARASARSARRGAGFGWTAPPPDPSTMPFQAPPRTSVSDEERIAILRMVQEKKITVEQAEQLLAALES